jgi:hypothetical protein
MVELKKQLEKGTIQKAYQGLMEYFMELRTHFQKKYPDHFVSSSLYYGYMDMTYFAFIPPSLKERKLKPAIVFVYDTFRFEIWLAAANKQVQSTYWELIKDSGWDKYRLVPTVKGYDSIIEDVLVEEPDFSDLDALTEQIERGTLDFIEDVERFLQSAA